MVVERGPRGASGGGPELVLEVEEGRRTTGFEGSSEEEEASAVVRV